MRLFGLLVCCLTTSMAAADLKLSLTAVAAEVPAGSPILLNAAVESSKETVPDVPSISPAAGNFFLWVANLNTGERTRYLGPQWSETERAASLQSVKVGSPVRSTLVLLAGADGDSLAFPPGRWQFNLQYMGLGADHPLYGQATVTVREPAPGPEAEWWKALQADPKLAAAIQTDAAGGKSAASLEALVRARSDAPQSRAAALALGRYYLESHKEPSKALEFFRMAGRPTVDGAIRREAMLGAAAALEASGATNEAASIRRQLQAEDAGVAPVSAPAPVKGPMPTVGAVKQP